MSDDLIRRSDAIRAYNEAMDELVKWQMEEWQLGDFSECEFNTTDCKHIVRKLEAIPSADRPQGKWIIEIDANGNTYGRCSICGMKQYAGQLNFCPDCGARMKGVDDETETQNSNLSFEKIIEKIQTQVIEFPDTHQKFIFTRKIEKDGDSIKICGWEYKGVKDED